MLSFFPLGVLDEILNLIESVSEGFPSHSLISFRVFCRPFAIFLGLFAFLRVFLPSFAIFLGLFAISQGLFAVFLLSFGSFCYLSGSFCRLFAIFPGRF